MQRSLAFEDKDNGFRWSDEEARPCKSEKLSFGN